MVEILNAVVHRVIPARGQKELCYGSFLPGWNHAKIKLTGRNIVLG